MDQNIEMLLCLLTEMRDAYARLNELSKQKQDCIICGDMESVGEIARMEWALFDEIAPLEESRKEFVEHICEQWEVPGGWATMAEVKKRTVGEAHEIIERTDDELEKIIAVQRVIHDHNMALLDSYFEHMYSVTKNLEDVDAKNNLSNWKSNKKRQSPDRR